MWPSRRMFRALLLAVTGGIVFWVPSVILHALRGSRFSGRDALLLSVLLPFICVASFELAAKLTHKAISPKFIAISMIVGMCVVGPLFMTISARLSEGRFAPLEAWKQMLVETIFFPVFTFMRSTYDGTLFALFLAAIALAWASSRMELKLARARSLSNPAGLSRLP